MKKIFIVLILFALVLTACQSLGVKAKEQANEEITKITPTPGQAALDVEAEPVIVFQRSGGFAGKTEQWSFYAYGKITKDTGEELSVDPAQVTALLEAIQAAGFFGMKASSGIGKFSNCKDCYTYQLTVNSTEKANTITVQQGAKDVPEAFWTLINQINSLIAGPTQQ